MPQGQIGRYVVCGMGYGVWGERGLRCYFDAGSVLSVLGDGFSLVNALVLVLGFELVLALVLGFSNGLYV